MDVLQAVALIVLVGLPFHLVARRELREMCDPRRIAASGVVAERAALEHCAEVIGCYEGGEIYRSVEFMGTRYRFDRIVPGTYREHVRARELFLEPGVVYRLDQATD